MKLNQEANVTENVRRIINSGFTSLHPFCSGQIIDFISIFQELRDLSVNDFRYCVSALKKIVEAQDDTCVGCYGKGLAYLVYLTWDIESEAHALFLAEYNNFSNRVKLSSDCEEELLEKMRAHGIRVSKIERETPGDREVILNLWYVQDEEGLVYSLRVKAYIDMGSDEEKMEFLRARAVCDYLIAAPFDVPADFHITMVTGNESRKMPIGHVKMFQIYGTPVAVFEEAIGEIERGFPAQSNLSIPDSPLVCVTALMLNSNGIIEPKIDERIKL